METFPYEVNPMKNVKRILIVGLALGLVGGGTALALRQTKNVEKAEAVIGAQYYVPVNTANFWSDQYNIGAQICQGNDTFFDPGRFYGTTRPLLNTVTINEGNTGDIRSDDFNQSGEYVSFLIGGNPNYNNEGHPQNFVNLWSTDKSFNVASEICNDAFQDPNISCNMIFKYVQVPSDYRGKCLMYIHDGTGNNFGGVTFGDLRINQTWDDVVEAFSSHIATYALSRNNQANIDAYNAVKNYYDTNAYYADLRTALAAKTSADDDFEKQNSLTNWAYDRLNSTYNDGVLASLDFESIISDVNVKQDDYFSVGMPSNKTGTYYVRAENSGLPEDAKYRIVSSEFTLSGSGFISAKLGGGTAVLQLLDENYNVLVSSATAAVEGTNILRPGFHGEANQGETFNLAETGVRLSTMSRVYLDCSAYVGDRVRVALTDARTGGNWGLAYFDEVKTYYENVPSFKVNVVSQADHYVVIPDEYVGSNTTDFGKAHAFWRSYLSLLREGNIDYCTVRTSNDVKALLNTYKGLSENARRIVCASQDYQRIGEGTWYDVNPTIFTPEDQYNMAHSLAYLADENAIEGVVVYGNSNLINKMNVQADKALALIIVISAVVIASLAAVHFVLKKKKENQ